MTKEQQMKRCVALLVCVLWASQAYGQPGCSSVFLPDLGPLGEAHVTGGIREGFSVPPTTAATGAFYPFDLYSTVAGLVGVWQNPDLLSMKGLREWHNVTSVSLVTWSSGFHATYAGAVRFVAYKTLPNSTPLGQLPVPSGAYRIPGHFSLPEQTLAMSGPVQLGEGWNVGVENDLPHPVWVTLQIEARICQNP